jgi:RNA recognition motif-containing protein
MNIYVGNLDFKVEENELEGLFKEFGSVNSVNIITDKYSGRSRGFGFVEMENDDDANKAINKLNGTLVKSREIIVNEAKPRKSDFNRY